MFNWSQCRTVGVLHSDGTVTILLVGATGVQVAVDRYSVKFEDTSGRVFEKVKAHTLHLLGSDTLCAVSGEGDLQWLSMIVSEDGTCGLSNKSSRVETVTPRLGAVVASQLSSTQCTISGPHDGAIVFANLLVVDPFTSQLFLMKSQDPFAAVASRLRECSLNESLLIARRFGISSSAVYKYYWFLVKMKNNFAVVNAASFPYETQILLDSLKGHVQGSYEFEQLMASTNFSSINWSAGVKDAKTLSEIFYNIDDDFWILAEILQYCDTDMLFWRYLVEAGVRLTEKPFRQYEEILARINLSDSEISARYFDGMLGSSGDANSGVISNFEPIPQSVLLMVCIRFHLQGVKHRLDFVSSIFHRSSGEDGGKSPAESIDELDVNQMLSVASSAKKQPEIPMFESMECSSFIDSLVDIWKQSIQRSQRVVGKLKEIVIADVDQILSSLQTSRLPCLVICSLPVLVTGLCQQEYFIELQELFNLFPIQLSPCLLEILEEIPLYSHPLRYESILPNVFKNQQPEEAIRQYETWLQWSSLCGDRIVTVPNEYHDEFRERRRASSLFQRITVSSVDEDNNKQRTFSRVLETVGGVKTRPSDAAILKWYVVRVVAYMSTGMTDHATSLIDALTKAFTQSLSSDGNDSTLVILLDICRLTEYFIRGQRTGLLPPDYLFGQWLLSPNIGRLDLLLRGVGGSCTTETVHDMIKDYTEYLFDDRRKKLDPYHSHDALVNFIVRHAETYKSKNFLWLASTVKDWGHYCCLSGIPDSAPEMQLRTAFAIAKHCCSNVADSASVRALELAVFVAEHSKPTMPTADRILKGLQPLLVLVVFSSILFDDVTRGLSLMWRLIESTPTSLPADYEFEFLSLALNELQVALEASEIMKGAVELPRLSMLMPKTVFRQVVVYLDSCGLQDPFCTAAEVTATAHRDFTNYFTDCKGIQRLEYIKSLLTGIGFLFAAMDTFLPEELNSVERTEGYNEGAVHRVSVEALSNRFSLHDAIILRMISNNCAAIAATFQDGYPSEELLRGLETVVELCTAHFDDVTPLWVARVMLVCVVHYHFLDVFSSVFHHLISMQTEDGVFAPPERFPEFGDDEEGGSRALGGKLVGMGLRMPDILSQALYKSKELINSAVSLDDDSLKQARSLLGVLENNMLSSVLSGSSKCAPETRTLAVNIVSEVHKLQLLDYLSSLDVDMLPLQLSIYSLDQLLPKILTPGTMNLLRCRHEDAELEEEPENDPQYVHGVQNINEKRKFRFLATKLATNLYASAKRTTAKVAQAAVFAASGHHTESPNVLDSLSSALLASDNCQQLLIFHHEAVAYAAVPGQQLIDLLYEVFGRSVSTRITVLLAIMSSFMLCSPPDPLRTFRVLLEVLRMDVAQLEKRDISLVLRQVEGLVGLLDCAESERRQLLYSCIRSEICARMWIWCRDDSIAYWSKFWKQAERPSTRMRGYESPLRSAAEALLATAYPNQKEIAYPILDNIGIKFNSEERNNYVVAAREILRNHIMDIMCPSCHLRCLGSPMTSTATLLSAATATPKVNDALLLLILCKDCNDEVDRGLELLDSMIADLERKLEASTMKRTKQSHVTVNESFVTKLMEKGYQR
jgi:hypothetical protein